MSLKTTVPAKRSKPEKFVGDAVSSMIGDESLLDRKVVRGVILGLRQIVIAMERDGYATKNETERCFEIINILDLER